MAESGSGTSPPGTELGNPKGRRKETLLKTGALQKAIFNSANFSSIATDAKGVIQIFNVGAERMLGYAAADVVNKITPADISDPQEIIARAEALSVELATPIAPGFDALVFKASRGIEDIYELTYIRKDGSRIPAVVSVSALRDAHNTLIGYLLIGTDNTARKQAEEAVRANHALLHTIHLHSIVSVTDRAGRIVDVNDGFCKISGYSRDELLGQTHRIVNSGVQTRAFWTDMWDSIAAGRPWRGEICNRTKEGSLYWVDSIIAPFMGEDGDTQGFISVRTDITARKGVEEAMRKSEERYSTIFNTMFAGFCIIEVMFDADNKAVDYRFLETNKAFEAQSGLLNAKGKRMRELAPAHEEHWFEIYGKIALTGEPASFVNEAKALNRWFEVSAHRFGDESSRNVSIFFQDVSSRQEGDEVLLKAGALQNAIFNSANFSSIATDAKGVIQIFNVGAERMLGYTAAEVMNKITPADISDPLEVIARAEALSVELGTPITPGFEALVFKASRGIEDIYELTYIRKDGSRFPAVVSVTALRDAQKAIIGYLLIGTDNTARKQVDGKLRTAAQYARSLIEASLDPLVTISPEGKITDVNEGSVKVTGVARERLIGTDFSDYFTEPEKAREGYQEAFSKGSVTDYPLTIRHEDGRLTEVLYNASVYKDIQGNVLGVFAAARDITARKRAEEALLEAGALQSAIFNSANFSSIATDAKGVIQIFNVGAERMLGYTAAEVMNKITPAEISDPQELIARARALSVELATTISPGFEALVFKASRGIEDIYELTYIRKDGTRFPAVVSVTALRDIHNAIIGYLLIGTDNTARQRVEAEQKKLDQRLRDQQFYTRSLIESNIDALMTTDPSGIISDVNKQMEALTGCTRDELIGAPFKNYFTDPQLAEAGIKRVLNENKVTDYELTARARDGRQTVVSYNATTFYDRDRNLQGVFAAARDVTERQLLDQALRETNVALEGAKLVAEKANLAKSDFLSSMSHELRSPLNAILGFAQLIESGSPAPTLSQKSSVDQILQAGWYLLELINEILDLALIESGKLALSTEPLSLGEVLGDCEAMIEPQAQKGGIQVTFPQFDLPCYVMADRTRTKQVFINLLSNAIKYNRAGGKVEVNCSATSSQRIRISVHDTGKGLLPEDLSQLFQPFNRLGQEAGDTEGTGIGLVVSKRLVELMGGEIGAESSVGVGSVFWVELNTSAAPELGANAVQAQAAAEPDSLAQPGARTYTLLCVEDNPANLLLVEKLVARRPEIRLLSARDGTLGIEIARESMPDVILMDINLPGISGIQAMKILAEDPATAHIPVVALSANAMPRDIEIGLDAGFFRYLTKPIRVSELMDTLDTAFKLATTRSPRASSEVTT